MNTGSSTSHRTPPKTMSANTPAPRMRVHTLVFKNKLLVPADLLSANETSVSQLRVWVASKLNFPAQEALLVAAGKKLEDSTRLSELVDAGTLDVFLVCRPPRNGEGTPIKIYVKDTTRAPNKMYAVKMLPGQTAKELKEKLFNKSSCKVSPKHQLLTCRGKVVDSSFTLREYVISQRRDRIVFYLSKNPQAADDEELALNVVLPNDTAHINMDLRANQSVQNLRQALERTHGIASAKFSLLNSAGLVLQNDMTLREACTMPVVKAVVASSSSVPPTMNLVLYAVPIAEEQLTHGLTGMHVYLNPEHHAALGIGTFDPSSEQKKPDTRPLPAKRKKSRRNASSSSCATAAKGSQVLKGFRGLFNKKKNSTPEPAAVSTENVPTAVDEALKDKRTKKKKSRTSYKSRMKAMMRSSRFNSLEDEVEQYRAKLNQSLGGGAYKRVDSI